MAAQGGFIRPDPKLDSAAVSARDAYLVLRDTLRTIDAASSRLTRDIRSGTGALLLSRVRAIRAGCAAALRAEEPARKNLLAAEVAQRTPTVRRTELEQSITELRAALTRCVEEYTGYVDRERPEEVRNTGNQLASATITTSHKFERIAERYLLAVGVKIRPYGAGPNPFAGSARQ